MKKSNTINLGGIIFHVDEDAFTQLQNYLNTIRSYFSKSDGQEEIIADIESRIAEFGQQAQAGALRLEDLTGGTFTITNGGVFGSMLSTPILNPPQSAILGMHKIQDRAMVVNGEVVARPMMYLALSYDHRIIDGREAVTFLVRVKECIEEPERLLFEI